jgi:superfamily II DNA or RNA helicase
LIYLREGRVSIQHSGDGAICAKVRGTRRYTVNLDVEDDVLLCECDCPYFQKNVAPCKHVWAATLAVEKQGLLPAGLVLKDLVPLSLDLESDLDGLPGGTEPFEEEFGSQREALERLRRSAYRAPRGRDARSAPEGRSNRFSRRLPPWKESMELLRALRRRRQEARQAFDPGRSEILYVVDLESTLQQQMMVVEIQRRDRHRDGSWGSHKPLHLSMGEAMALPDAVDRRLIALLQGAVPPSWPSYQPEYDRAATHAAIPGPAVDLILREICASGRCQVRRRRGMEPGPLSYEDGDPWQLTIEVQAANEGTDYIMSACLTRGEQRIPVDRPDLYLASGHAIEGALIRPFEHHGAFTLIPALRASGGLRLPQGQTPGFIAEILQSASGLPLHLPEEMRFETVRAEPKLSLRVRRPKRSLPAGRLSAEVAFDYEGQAVPPDAEPAPIVDSAARRVIPRDLGAESAALNLLDSLGFMPVIRIRPGEATTHHVAPRRLVLAVPQLLRAGWRVEADGKLYRPPSSTRAEVTSGVDWFELRGGATYDGEEIPLPTLLAAMRKGETTVLLGDGSLGLLPEEWLRRYATVAGLGEGKGDHLRFGAAQAGFLDALLSAEPDACCDAVFERVRQKLRAFGGVKMAGKPRGFRGKLRGYQREGLGWLLFLREFGLGGCLADDMGLGKTIQALALLQLLHERKEGVRRNPSLVVAPRSVVFNWIEEARRFTPGLRVRDHTGMARDRTKESLLDSNVVVTTYGTLRRDIGFLREIPFDTVILDESQAIKNPGSQSAKAARLLHGRQRLALSGTPVENHLGELWSLFEFLNPGMLGSASAFRAGRGIVKDAGEPSRELMARALRPFILRRTKSQVAPDLPAKTEQTLTCELKGRQRTLYRELLQHYRGSLLSRVRRDGLSRSKIHVLEALLRLRQAACHPGLIDRRRAREESAKLDLLFSQLEEVLDEGHKVLVFSQFTSLLALVKSRLDDRGISYSYLDGAMAAGRRKEAIRRFQEEAGCPLFLLSLRAGGYGLNLTAAGYVYLLDPWWNPAVEAQAIDRTHRIGQTHPVFAYRIVATGTIEEKILELQASKRRLAESILSADSSLMRTLTREDLELLLS